MATGDRPTEPSDARRHFLTTAAGATAALLVGQHTGWADAPASSAGARERALAFVNTHTGESVSVAYWCDGAYRSDALAKLNRVLRDHRTGDVRDIDCRLFDLLHALRTDLDTRTPFHVI